MWNRLRLLWSVTAVRLSVAYTLAFGLLALFLVFYMSGSAVQFLTSQYRDAIEREAAGLQLVYERRGINAMIREMEFRSRGPGASLYVVADKEGNILAGNVRDLDKKILITNGWTRHPFPYDGFGDQTNRKDDERSRAVAVTFSLPDAMQVMVGKDIGDPDRFRNIVRRALGLSMTMMLVAGFLIWFFLGRRALKRIDMVSRSTERIMAGDRAERLPVTGANDEFDRLSARMNNMLDRISTLDSGLRDVSDSIAHDLKTPLTRLRNKVEAALASDPGKREAQDVLNEVIADSDSIIKTFNALLMISRVESGSQVAELNGLDLTELVHDVHELYEPVAEEEGVELRLETAPGVKTIGNRELLAQGLTNLLDNSLKYGRPENGNPAVVTLRLESGGGKAVISVSDNGPGIPSEHRDKVRERFHRLDKSRSKPGSGLGLALVEAVAKLHSGTLELGDSEPGLSARLVLPAK